MPFFPYLWGRGKKGGWMVAALVRKEKEEGYIGHPIDGNRLRREGRADASLSKGKKGENR